MCCTLFHQLKISVCQRLRQHELSGCIRVKDINIRRRGIVDVLCDPFTGIGIAYLEANSRRWDDLPGFRVFFDDLNEGLKGGVVDEIPIHLAVFAHIHVKGRHQLRAFPALGLFYREHAVRQLLCFSKTEFITNKDISFRLLCFCIAARTLEEHLELGAFFRRFDLS